MTREAPSGRGFTKLAAILSLTIAGVAVIALLFFGGSLRRLFRETLMARVTSGDYEILCPRGALTENAMTQFAAQREPLFAALQRKLPGIDSNVRIRIILDPTFPGPPASDTARQSYSVAGTTIRTKLIKPAPKLPAAADAEALLNAAWGAAGNASIARWTAIWLVGEWRGTEIGMAAAQVEQRLGHEKVESVLVDPGGEIASPDDRALLGAAWISEVAQFGGSDEVKKLYSAKMPHLNVAEVTRVLGTNPLELDRKWQMWMYAYLAGMPSTPGDSSMPMNMPMPGSH